MKRGLLCGASVAAVTIVAGLSGSQALAQTAAAAAATTGTNGTGEVIVTAEKRSVSVEKVPVAVSAFTGRQRDLVGIKSVQDLTDYTPGFSYNTEANRPYIRGVGRNTDNLATESAVAVYYDNVYYGAGAQTLLQHDSLFIDRIEILRGPQSTLYGRNSDGGAVNYFSKPPSKTWEEEICVGVANYSTYFGEARVSGPINDNIRFSVSGNYTEDNGDYYHDLNGGGQGGSIVQGDSGTSRYVEAQVAGTYENLDWNAKVSSGTFRTNYQTGAQFGPVGDYEFTAAAGLSPSGFFGLCDSAIVGNTGIGCTGPSSGPDQVVTGSTVTQPHAALANPSAVNDRNFISDFRGNNDQRSDIALDFQATYHFPAADLKYIGGYQSFYYNLLIPATLGSGVISYQLKGPATVQPLCGAFFSSNIAGCTQNLTIDASQGHAIFIEDEQFFSHELDLTSTWKGPFQYILGLYWYHEHFTQPFSVVDPAQPQVLMPQYLGAGFSPAPLNPSGALLGSFTDMSGDSYAAFGQVDWNITDTLKLTGGLRYTEDFKSGVQEDRFITFATETGLPSPPFPAGSTTGVNTFGANTPAIDATALFTPGTAFKGAGVPFLNTKTGFWERNLSGNWNAVTGTAGAEWTPDTHNLIYLKYSRGYKTGGFSTETLGANPETAAEYVDAYEAGWKLNYHTFQLNAAAFYYDYQNDQQPLTVIVASTPIAEIFNIPHDHTYGVELEGSGIRSTR